MLSVPAPTFGIAMVASSNVVVPPAESIVRLPDDVSISFAPVTPIRILLPQTPAVPSTVANVTLSPAHKPISSVALPPLSRVKPILPCVELAAVQNAELNVVTHVSVILTVGFAAVPPIVIVPLPAVTLHTVPAPVASTYALVAAS